MPKVSVLGDQAPAAPAKTTASGSTGFAKTTTTKSTQKGTGVSKTPATAKTTPTTSATPAAKTFGKTSSTVSTKAAKTSRGSTTITPQVQEQKPIVEMPTKSQIQDRQDALRNRQATKTGLPSSPVNNPSVKTPNPQPMIGQHQQTIRESQEFAQQKARDQRTTELLGPNASNRSIVSLYTDAAGGEGFHSNDSMRRMRAQIDSMWTQEVQPAWDKYLQAQEDLRAGKISLDEAQEAYEAYQRVFYKYDPLQKAFDAVQRSVGVDQHSGDSYEDLLSVSERWDAAINASEQKLKDLGDQLDQLDQDYNDAVAAYEKNKTRENAQRVNAIVNNLNRLSGEYQAAAFVFNEMAGNAESLDNMADAALHRDHPEVFWLPNVGETRTNAKGETEIHYTASYDEVEDRIHDLERQAAEATSSAEKEIILREAKWYQGILSTGAIFQDMTGTELQENRDRLSEQVEEYNTTMRRLQWDMDELAFNGMTESPEYQSLLDQYNAAEEARGDLQYQVNVIDRHMDQNAHQEVLDDLTRGTQNEFDKFIDLAAAWGDMSSYIRGDMPSDYQLNVEMSAPELVKLSENLRDALMEEGLTADQAQSMMLYATREANFKRTAELRKATIDKAGDTGWLLNWLSATGNSLASGLGYLDLAWQGMNGYKDAYTGKSTIDYNTESQDFYTRQNAYAEEQFSRYYNRMLAQNGDDEEIANAKAQARMNWYNLSLSMGQSTAVAGLSLLGVPGALLLLSGSAATQTAQEMHERGYSDGAALTAGALAGFAEYITEKIALDSLLEGFTRAAKAGMTPTQIFKQSMINLGVQGWTEGAEEGLSDIINRFGDELVIRYLNGGVSDIEMKARELQLQGDMSWDEAKSAAEKDWVVTFAKDVWNGALSGIMMGGGGTAISGISSALGDVATGYRAENNGLTNAVLEQIGSIDRATADLAGMKNDDALKKSNIGSWYQLGHAINNFADVYAVDAINARLQALGEAEISEDLIRGIDAASHGYRLNPLERQAIVESQFGQQVTDELKGFRDAQESYFKKARADRDYSPESYRSFLSTFDGQENSWAAEAERIGRETTMDFSRPVDDRDYTSVVDSAYDAQTGSSRLQGDPAQVIQQMLRTGVASESELRNIQQSKELRAEYEKQTGQKLSKNATNARREMRQHLASPNATAEEKAFIRAKNNNPDATVLGPAATALAKAGLTDMNKALSYGKILDAIADGQAVSPFDLRRLDLNNPAVRTVFGERTGMMNLPNNITTELKRALVDRAIQEVQKTRQNQEAIAEGAEQLLELQQEKAQAELKDAMTKDGQGRLRKTAAERRAEKSQRKTNIQRAFEERAAAAGRYQRIDVRGKSERQVLTQVQDQANDHSIWSKSAFEQSFREANNIGDRSLTSGEMATLDTIYNNYLLAKRLTTQERIALNDAYANAEEAAKELDNQAVEVKAVDPAKRLQRQMKRGAGKVLYESNVDMDKLTEHQRTGLRVLMRLARALGVTFHIYQTEKVNGQGQIWIDKEGRKHSDNGWYDKKTGDVWLDINAGQLGQGTLLFTAAHELTHWIRDWSPTKFQALAKFLLDRYAEHGVKRSKIEKLKLLEYARGGVDLSTEEGAALEEAVADAMETMLTSPDVLQAIDELKAVDASTGNAVVRFLKSFVDTVQKVYSKFRPDSREGRFVASLEKDQLAELQKLFVEGLADAAEQYQAWDPKVDIDGDPVPQQYSIRSMTEGMGLKFEKTEDGGFRILDQDDKPVKKVTPDQVVNTPLGNLITLALENDNISAKDAGVQYKFLADLMNMIIEYRDAALIWEIAGSQIFSAIRNNSDTQYGLTIDFSTVCKKTQQIVDVMSGAMEKLGRGLTRAEVEMAYRKTQGAGEPVPCPVCYVFSRWMGIGGILNQIAKYQEKYAKMPEEELVKFMLDVEADVNAYAEKTGKSFGKAISAMKSAAESEYKSLDKKLANSIKARLEIAEFEALLANETKKSEQTKLRSKIKARQAKVLSAEEEAKVQRQLTEAENNPEKERLEAYQFLNGTILLYDKKTKTWSKNSEYKPVPASVLFNLNKGADFAANYPFTWKFRTTKGCAAGKAIMPFSDARVGESIQGVAAGTVANIKTDPSLNPFTNGDTKAMQKTLDQARIKARRQNLIGGTRYQSTSDFRYEYGSDYLITFLEMQAMGSKVQLYTKVIEAVDFLATMGADCNLSVMPLNNGYVGDKLVYSSVTGINAEAAIQKAHEYDNVQLILVGISDEHIRLALAGTDVTFVIPFHGSGNTTKQIQTLMNAVNEDLDVTTARDYSTVQTDKVDPNRTAEQEAMWDLRMAIIMGLAQENIPAELEKILSGENEDASEGAKYRQSLHDRFGTDTPERRDLLKKNPFLKDLYDRFYVEGKDADAYQCWLAQDQAEQIFPYEYWDKTLTYDEADQNGDRFRDYCARMGIIPRFTGKTVKGGKVVDAMTTLPDGSKVAFGDFSKDKGYWKLLIDRKMYNNRYDENGNWIGYGTYHEQKPINCTNFDAQTIDPKYGSLTYGEFMTPANDRSKTAQIVQTVVDEINGVKHSVRGPRMETVDASTEEVLDDLENHDFKDPEIGENVKYSIRESGTFNPLRNPDGSVKLVYKAFYAMDGGLYPPMIANMSDAEKKKIKNAVSGTLSSLDTPVGVVLDAEVGKMARYKNDATEYDVVFSKLWKGSSKTIKQIKSELAAEGYDIKRGLNSTIRAEVEKRMEARFPELRKASKDKIVERAGELVRNESGRLAVVNAKGGGTLAFRPGWHLGEWPNLTQFNVTDPFTGEEKAAMPDSLVFCACEIAGDIDYQLDAMELGMTANGGFDRTQAGLPFVPVDGYYKYRTNADPTTAPWYITGSIRVVSILDDEDCRRICAKYGVTPQPRASHKDIDLAAYGLKRGPVTPLSEDKLQAYKKSKAAVQNEAELKEALEDPDFQDAYVFRRINFEDQEILKEFGRNGQDVEYYREQYAQRNAPAERRGVYSAEQNNTMHSVRYRARDITMGLNFNDPNGVLLDRMFNDEKQYETRLYTDAQGNGRLPRAYLNKPMGIIQTGAGKAKLVGFWELGDGELRDYDWLSKPENRKALGNDGTAFEAKPGEKRWVYPIKWVEQITPVEVDTRGIQARDISSITSQMTDTMHSIRQPIQTAEEAAALIDKEMGKGTAKKIKQTLRYFEQRAAKAEKQAEQARETLKAKQLLHKQTLKRAAAGSRMLQHTANMQIAEINRQKREMQRKLDKVVKDRHELLKTVDEMKVDEEWRVKMAQSKGEQDLIAQRRIYEDKLNYNARTDRQWARGQYLSAVRETKKADRKALREAVRVERQVNSMESHKAAQIKRKFENRAAQVVINHGADLAVPMPFDGKNERAKEAVNFRLAVEEALGKGYRMMVNALQGVDNFAKDQTRTDNASVWVNIVRGSKSMSERFFTEGLLDKAGNVIGPSMSDTLLIKDEKGQVNQTLQEVLNNYMFHLHNTDRMSLEARANAMVDAYVQQHPWLRDMTERDLRQYVHDDNQIVLEYVRLMRWALTINNKEVLAWEDETPVTAEESQRFIDEVKANYPEIVDKANEIYKWWDVFMQEWAVGTSISQEQYNFMREIYPHYVPTFREFGDKKARMLGPTMTADSITSGQVTKKAEGSTRQLLRMEDQYVKSLRQIIRMNRQNAFLQNIIEEFLFDDEGVFAKHGFFDWEGAEPGMADNFWEFTKTQNTDSVEKTKDGMYKITCWVNGEKMSAYVNRAMFEGIAFLFDRSPEWVKQFTKIGNKLTGPMKSMITGLNPFFAAKNIIRDQHTALVNSVAGVAFPKYLAQAAAKIATNDEDWIIFQNLGGVSATMHTMEGGFADAMDTGLNQIRNAATWKKPLKAIKAMDTKVQEVLGKPGEWSESVTRFAEYLATIDMRGGDTAETRMEGIRNAAEVTVDFGRRGTLGTVLNAWVPYWNPGVQGLDKAIRNVFMQPTVKECMERAGRAVLVNIIPQALAIALTMALGEWDEYEKLSDQVKDHYYCIPMGWLNPKWKNKFLKIPKSQDWAAFISTPFMRIIEGVNGRDNPFENYYETALDSVLPFQIRDSAFGGKTITLDAIVAGQVADLRSNTNYAGASIVPYALLDASAKEQWDADTSVLAKAIGQIFNKSPMKLDYFLENYMGNFFGTIAAAIPYSPFSPVGYYTGEVDRLDQLNEAIRTVLSPFVADNRYSNHIRASYYEMYNELKQRYTDAGAHGDPKSMEDYEFYKALTMTNGYADQITEMARYVRELPPGEEKDLGYEALAGLSSEALEFYEAYKNGDVKDPVQWMTYNRYGERILKETARLSKYEEDFNFNGMLGNPTTVFDRSGDNDVKFKLDEAQQDLYAHFRAGRYQQILNQTISNEEYKNAPNDQVRAQLLEDAKREALRLAESDMISYLNRNHIKGETITKTDYTYVEKQAAYMISRILGDDNAYDKLITDTLIRLYDYGENYSFNPTDTTSRKTFTSQTQEGQVYVLTEDQQHKYSELYHDVLSDYYTKVINSREFQDAYEEEQAAMLARAKTYATNKVYEDFNTWLERTGAQSETKFRADEVMSLEAKYAVQRALGMDESYPLELTGELIRLYDNKSVGSQSYLPPSYRPTSYSVPGRKGYKWILTADQKDVYESMAQDIYQHDMLEVIRSSAYARASDYDKAQLLCATRDQVTDKAREQFIAWLQQTATPTWTKGPEEQARQQDIKYAERVVDSILG